MYRKFEGTADLNGIHGVRRTISSVVVQEKDCNLKYMHRVFLKMKKM
jgi:hypothetical protein